MTSLRLDCKPKMLPWIVTRLIICGKETLKGKGFLLVFEFCHSHCLSVDMILNFSRKTIKFLTVLNICRNYH